MNSVHDIGGTDGFGPVHEEANEPVFHEPWEARVFGMMMLRAGGETEAIPLDAARHRLERLPPAQYLSSSYYQRWLAAKETGIIEGGVLKLEEIDARTAQFAADPNLMMPRREDRVFAAKIPEIVRSGSPNTRSIRTMPRFAIGDRVMTRNLNPHGHTRLPRYTRNKHGVIAAHHGAHVFPDTNAHGLGENPQHLYTVRISARELWGDAAEPNQCVLIDLWESYLAPDAVAAKAPSVKRAMRTRPAKAKLTKAKAAKAKSVKKKPMTAKASALTGKPASGKAKPTRKKTR